MLLNPELEQEIEDADNEDVIDPTFNPVIADEDATPEEERQLYKAMDIVTDFLYSEEGMASVVEVLQQDNRELYEKVADVSEQLLLKARGDMKRDNEAVPSSIFFGEGGLLTTVPLMVLDLAEQLQLPHANDKDTISATMINMYKKAGETILREGNKTAAKEAIEMGAEMALIGENGKSRHPDEIMNEAKAEGPPPERQPLAAGIEQGLLGV